MRLLATGSKIALENLATLISDRFTDFEYCPSSCGDTWYLYGKRVV